MCSLRASTYVWVGGWCWTFWLILSLSLYTRPSLDSNGIIHRESITRPSLPKLQTLMHTNLIYIFLLLLLLLLLLLTKHERWDRTMEARGKKRRYRHLPLKHSQEITTTTTTTTRWTKMRVPPLCKRGLIDAVDPICAMMKHDCKCLMSSSLENMKLDCKTRNCDTH